MIADSLRDILREFVNVDTDAGELAEMLHDRERPSWLSSFHDEMAGAIRAGDLTPSSANEIMMRKFPNQQTLDRWLRSAWAEWFPGEPYPA